MYEYKLDTYLKSFCSEHPEYMNLYSTWNLNKGTCSNALKTIVINYPHFSMHDASHAEAILSKIEMLLGKRISNLSPTDTWLILHAAYTHDLGMVLRWDEIEKEWETPNFQKYLSSLADSRDSELRSAAIYIQSLKEPYHDCLWPLKTHRYVNLINASYFRGQHSHISRKYIDALGSDLSIDLGHNNMVQPRLLKLLGKICELHTAPLEQVLTLNYQTDGFGSDYAHPRFVAMLLRLGDLLDIDNDRFNTACELVAGGLPATSVPHKEKHDATTHILVTPEEIQFSSDCPNSQAYLETRNFVTWLETEVDFFTKYWAQVAPREIGGYAPRLDKKELIINGIPDIEGVAGLSFQISQEKAFQIIEGSNIYEDRFVFIREVIQNAMDASKLQLWNDINTGTYRAWIETNDFSKLQPYDIDEKIYQNYPIKIELSTLSDGATQILVTDRGTGISVDSFKRMCNVGTSNAGSEKLQTSIAQMPSWLQPTAGFGVGLQSIFLMTDQFEIDTNTGTEAYHAVAHSHRSGGYLQLQPKDILSGRGTTISITFHMPKMFRFSFSGDTNKYLSVHFDPMSSENHTGEARILDAIKSNCGSSLFPIPVSCAEAFLESTEITSTLPACDAHSWDIEGERYRFQLRKDLGSIKLWDMHKAVYGEFQLIGRDYCLNQIQYKGSFIEKHKPFFRQEGLTSLIDVYGMKTKETISLDRSSLTENGAKEIAEILEEMSDTYKECVIKRLESTKSEEYCQICTSKKFDSYLFWCLCNAKQRKRIPSGILKNITKKATVLIKSDGKYIEQDEDVKDLIPFKSYIYFINLSQFYKTDDSFDYESICEILNRSESLNEKVIADKILTEAANIYNIKRLIVPQIDENLVIYEITDSDESLLSVEGNARTAVMRGLSAPIKGSVNYQSNLAKRYAIPALDDYSDLAVDQIPSGIALSRFGLGFKYFIIAPFDRDQAKMRENLSMEGFTDMVLASTTFSNVVQHVLEHSYKREFLTKEKVIDAYIRLINEYYTVLSK